jgi:hypothetical protein
MTIVSTLVWQRVSAKYSHHQASIKHYTYVNFDSILA